MNRPIAAFGEQAFAYRDYLKGPSGRLRQEIEYLPDPRPALAALRHILRPDGWLSLITVNRRQESLRLAIRDQQFPEALEALTCLPVRDRTQTGTTLSPDSLFGVKRLAFGREELEAILQKAGFEVVEEGGISIFIDYRQRDVENPCTHAHTGSTELLRLTGPRNIARNTGGTPDPSHPEGPRREIDSAPRSFACHDTFVGAGLIPAR